MLRVYATTVALGDEDRIIKTHHGKRTSVMAALVSSTHGLELSVIELHNAISR
jgi:hypothetical protein